MGKSTRVTADNVRQIGRLASDLRELRHDRHAMYGRLIDGMCGMLGATCGFSLDCADWRPGGNIQISGVTSDSHSDGALAEIMRGLARAGSLWEDPSFAKGVELQGEVESVPFHQLLPQDEFHRYPMVRELCRDLRHVDHLISWHRIGPRRRDIRGVAVHRWGKPARRFGSREIEIGRLMFAELDWLERSGRFEMPPDCLTDLPPRLAEVLELLRAGHAPKRIARTLGLSVHTVRDHVKRLYARADVGDRAALMALFNGRAPSPPPSRATAAV
jgi:DNA-binding CsgD family transcriptional regulator